MNFWTARRQSRRSSASAIISLGGVAAAIRAAKPSVPLPASCALLLLLLCCATTPSAARPLPAVSDEAITDEVHSYLTSFGYLPRGNPEISNLRREDVVRKALNRLQQFAGLPVTGNLDEATKELMKTKRCGLPDVLYPQGRLRRYTLQGSKWPKTNLTYKVATYTKHIGLGRTRRVIHDALNVWASASALTFTETSDSNADIIVDFFKQDHGDGYPFDGPNVVLAHAFFPGFGRGGDAHFDDDEAWTDGVEENNMVNLFSVAVHEFGHSLGMGHSRVRESLMFPYYTGYMEDLKLSSDDIYGIQRLYGSGHYTSATTPAPEPEDETTTSTPSSGGDADSGTTAVALPNTTENVPSVPNVCESSVDAVARIRNEIFIFKEKYFWRIDDSGYLIESPTEIDRFWYGFNEVIDHIDAVYERPRIDKIIFFIGRKYWEFSANMARVGYPRNITELGFPEYVKKIDAAFVWEYNDKTYFFTGDQYWRFNEETNTVEADYPRKLSIWEGVPHSVDAAFTDSDGITYFFKNNAVLRFNSYFMRVERDYPTDLRSFWKHCQPPSHQRHNDHAPSLPAKDRSGAHVAKPTSLLSLCMLLIPVTAFSSLV